MASLLKRKRGAVEVMDAPKRSKSVNNSTEPTFPAANSKSGWEAAFPAPPKEQDLVKTNGANGGLASSPEVLDFDDVQSESYQVMEEERLQRVKEYENAQKALKRAVKRREQHAWKLSEPIGGRMINADPAFTPGEKFLVTANRTTINVHSTATSLLHRTIKLKLDTNANARIITYCLSPTYENILWVACSDGSIFSVDWTNGAGADQFWGISSTGCVHMTVASMESAGRRRDVVLTTEPRRGGGFRITANELAPPNGPIKTEARTIHTSEFEVNFLHTSNDGSVIVAAAGRKILIGRLRATDYDTVDKIKYEFRVFETGDQISCLDLRVTKRTGPSELKKAVAKLPVVNIVVGDIQGVVFYHTDILAKLIMSQDGALPTGYSIVPKKMHWHRKTVQAVKFSLDGNYIISGGSETVLTLWQLDTGKQQHLPHMTATIQNVVVSPSGSSYAIQLADNSAMVLSTADLKPTANIAGIQSNVVKVGGVDRVKRVEDERWGRPILPHTSAVINPSDPSKLLLSVGLIQEVNFQNPVVTGSPFLQTFDMGLGVSLSRQAVSRNNIINKNITPNANRVSEPRITQMKISPDGQWLATIDEWCPPKRDLAFLENSGRDGKDEQVQRREIFLKFWQWTQESKTWELVSRIDSPHAIVNTPGVAGRILDLVVDPTSCMFATIGEDEMVRTWVPKTRKRDGVVVKGKDSSVYKSWQCEHAISIGKPELAEGEELPISGSLAFSEDGSLLAAACETNGAIHFLDPESGTIRLSHTGLFENDILRMDFLAQDLIILSDKLNVFDLTAGELRSSISLTFDGPMDTIQKREMFHLAVDCKSRTYAVSIPQFQLPQSQNDLKRELTLFNMTYSHTELLLFHQDKGEPELSEQFPALVTALLPAVGSEGFVLLDSAAEIKVVLKKGTNAITTTAQSTSAQQLDMVSEEIATEPLLLKEDAEEVEDMEVIADQDEVDDDGTPVVSQQQLARIFDIGPSYALPPLEQMFYEVAGLFSSKPLGQAV